MKTSIVVGSYIFHIFKHETYEVSSGQAYRIFFTVNPLYTNTRYNDKILYNDNLTGTKPSLKKWQLIKKYA